MAPKHLLIEITGALSGFRSLLAHPELPQLDLEAALSQIVEEVRVLEQIDDRLANAAQWMAWGEGLFENSALSAVMEEKIVHAVVQLGSAIKNELLRIHAYRFGISPFTYRSLVNDTTILLSQTSLGFAYAQVRHFGRPPAHSAFSR